MKRFLAVAVAFVALAGCDKGKGTSPTTEEKINPIPNQFAPPGPGGAVQDVRKAVGRAVTQNELNNLRLFIDTASGASGQMPTQQEILAGVQKDDRKLAQAIQQGDIVLTGTRSREGVWAYTKEVQRNGNHYAVTSNGVEEMSPATLQQRLKNQ